MNDTAVEDVNLPDPSIELTRADRCDRCGAQAYYRYLFESGDLLFCQHHQHDHNKALEVYPAFSQFSFPIEKSV